MKHILFVLSVLFLFSCGGENEEKSAEDFSNITFSMDTVMVDSGEDFINLSGGLWVSAISKDHKYLYNWNQEASELDKVNLDQLVLEEKIKFEKEGPNGVGNYISWISLMGNNEIVFANFQDMALLNFQGEKLRTYKLNGEKFEGDSLEAYESFTRRAIISDDGNIMYGILGNWTGKNFYLAKVDYQNKTLKKHELPGFEKLADYSVTLKSDQMMMISAPDQFITEVEGKLIISNSAFNTILVYEEANDSLYQVDYDTKLTKTGKTGKYVTEVESEKDFNNAMNEINQEINFRNPIWDSKNQRFYRFSYETLPKENIQDEEEKQKSKVYLTILDKDFKVLGETLVKEFSKYPSMHFVKDGKIWMYENVDDELGFIRIGIN
ncbi:DUF4221 domain-containing protein [Aquiflexum gelatinilyticum]|uniref:DUF4221 domain-containing protein n=1 Tax=Aquiflexum gelatinilyticum TaxID=2961943 RepID=A0A9X2SZM2_9BACT|nr:DUF4221 domain-containing protein [Aquiflexum gelatinilyticum]MCR9016877.1 DUF4221 domain-containing protein [Aquiflexum gelatinilyticum]